ncbi:MAG: lipopolysaccharide assembly protein LapA domain-containing protein [Spirochaetota bacterium]
MRFILGIIIGALVIIFMVQNSQMVDIQFYAWNVSVSRAVMILLVFVAGILVGWVVRSLGYRRRKREEERAA